MKQNFTSLVNRLLRITTFTALLFVGNTMLVQGQQNNPAQCIANIQKRLETLGDAANCSYPELRTIMRNSDYGKIPDVVADPGKAAAFKRVFTSLSKFIDLAPNAISGKGMRGYTKHSRLLTRVGDTTKTDKYIAQLEDSFTHNGKFEGPDFDKVMTQLDDESKFEFDGVNGTFTSKVQGANGKLYRYPTNPNEYGQGEGDAITHILHGHTKNKFTDGKDKSLFLDKSEVLNLIDEAMKRPIADRIPNPGSSKAFTVDLGKTVGYPRGQPVGTTTNKITIFVREENGIEIIETAYPE